MRTTLLFIPVLAERFLAKAHERGADAAILDLEDSIPEAQKDAARAALSPAARQLREQGMEGWVRVNNTPQLLVHDIEAAVAAGVHGLLVPKVELAAQVISLDSIIANLERQEGKQPNSVRLALTLETPKGILIAAQLPVVPRVEALAFGGEDFAATLGVRPSPTSLRVPAQMVALAASAYGVEAWGLAGSIANHSRLGEYRRAVRLSRALGFTGTLCVHPQQVSIASDAFRPSTDEIAWAHEVAEQFESAAAQGTGSITVRGQMVDEPVYQRARRLLSRRKDRMS